METVLVSLVTIGLIIISVLTLMTNSFHAVVALSDSWKYMEANTSDIVRTDITTVPTGNYTGGNIALTVRNEGATELGDFASWDVITAYPAGEIAYMTYTDDYSPGGNEWVVAGIYLPGGGAEVFDVGILNPGEEMELALNLSPGISENETVRITVATPNGVTAQSLVTRVSPE